MSNHETINFHGLVVPHPDALRIKVRDLAILVENAKFPVDDWSGELLKLRLLLLLAETVHEDTP